MLLVRGEAEGTELTGTIYEKGEEPPQFRGSPDDDASYVWVCDEFYEVDSGGSKQVIGDREIQIAFESPMPRGFESREQALESAREHVRTQFVRLGVDREDVSIEIVTVDDESEHADNESAQADNESEHTQQ